MRTPEKIVMDRFTAAGVSPRSAAYIEGCYHTLRRKMCGEPVKPVPYDLGTPYADAYLAGEEEGKRLYRLEAEHGAIWGHLGERT